jgi:hypothetical protein
LALSGLSYRDLPITGEGRHTTCRRTAVAVIGTSDERRPHQRRNRLPCDALPGGDHAHRAGARPRAGRAAFGDPAPPLGIGEALAALTAGALATGQPIDSAFEIGAICVVLVPS